MVAYSFMNQFVPLIESGEKRQTIRLVGKRRHARPGEMLQLYRDARTKQMRKIIEDQECTACLPILLRLGENLGEVLVACDGKTIEDLGPFAHEDGFRPSGNLGPVARMWQHFYSDLGAGMHHCRLIKWAPPQRGLLGIALGLALMAQCLPAQAAPSELGTKAAYCAAVAHRGAQLASEDQGAVRKYRSLAEMSAVVSRIAIRKRAPERWEAKLEATRQLTSSAVQLRAKMPGGLVAAIAECIPLWGQLIEKAKRRVRAN